MLGMSFRISYFSSLRQLKLLVTRALKCLSSSFFLLSVFGVRADSILSLTKILCTCTSVYMYKSAKLSFRSSFSELKRNSELCTTQGELVDLVLKKRKDYRPKRSAGYITLAYFSSLCWFIPLPQLDFS